MPEKLRDGLDIRATLDERRSKGMPQRVWGDVGQAGAPGGRCDEPLKRVYLYRKQARIRGDIVLSQVAVECLGKLRRDGHHAVLVSLSMANRDVAVLDVGRA